MQINKIKETKLKGYPIRNVAKIRRCVGSIKDLPTRVSSANEWFLLFNKVIGFQTALVEYKAAATE